MNRESGYYWVFGCIGQGASIPEWAILYYDSIDREWYSHKRILHFKDEHFLEIHEKRIKQPNER